MLSFLLFGSAVLVWVGGAVPLSLVFLREIDASLHPPILHGMVGSSFLQTVKINIITSSKPQSRHMEKWRALVLE